MRITATVSILMAIAASPVFADCTPPSDSVAIPSGATATKEEMIAAQSAVRAFDEAVKAYSDCLKQDTDAKVTAGGDKAKLGAAYIKANNEEVAKLQEVADKFNVELRAYKAKNSPSPQ
jgi:hypothetical protein